MIFILQSSPGFVRKSPHFRRFTESGLRAHFCFFMAGDVAKICFLVEPILNELGYELIDIQHLTEHGRWILRILIDRESGITLGDCQRVSREVETLLDVEEVIGRGSYLLEVSSPGFNRPLVKESDFTRYAEKRISLKTPLRPSTGPFRRIFSSGAKC